MARGKRRVAVSGCGGRPGCGGGFVPGSTEDFTPGWRYVAAQLWMLRLDAEQKKSMKRLIESSDVVPERDIIRIVAGSDTPLTDYEDIDKFGPLHEAANMETLDTCKYLVEDLGFDINDVLNNDSGITPLSCAVLRGKSIVARYFLDKGADPNKEDIIGCTPLHYATKQGDEGLVRLLISKGASVNASSSEGTPIHIAASHGKSVIMQILLQNNADPNRVSADLGTPMVAAVFGATSVSESAALKCMKLLVKAGAVLNYAYPDTALVIATSKGLSECVNYLLELGADANITINHGGITPIEIAANCGRWELVEILFPHTSPIQSVSNWSVEGIIAHANPIHSNDKDGSWEKLEEAFQLFQSPPLLPLPPAHHLSPHYDTAQPAELVPTLPPEQHIYMSPYYFSATPIQHLATFYKPIPLQFAKPTPTFLPQPCSVTNLSIEQLKKDESQGRK